VFDLVIESRQWLGLDHYLKESHDDVGMESVDVDRQPRRMSHKS